MFFDAEYTSVSKYRDKGIRELIQIGVVTCVCYLEKNRIVKMEEDMRFSAYVKPVINEQLSEYIKGLTGITQECVDAGMSQQKAADILLNIVNDDVYRIYVWGPDNIILRRAFLNAGISSKICNRITKKMHDISDIVSSRIGFSKTLSQKEACKILKIDLFGKEHDAFSDAVNLMQLYNKVFVRPEKINAKSYNI